MQTPSCHHKEIPVTCTKYGSFDVHLGTAVLCSFGTGTGNKQPISFYASLHQNVTEDEAAENGVLFEKNFPHVQNRHPALIHPQEI